MLRQSGSTRTRTFERFEFYGFSSKLTMTLVSQLVCESLGYFVTLQRSVAERKANRESVLETSKFYRACMQVIFQELEKSGAIALLKEESSISNFGIDS